MEGAQLRWAIHGVISPKKLDFIFWEEHLALHQFERRAHLGLDPEPHGWQMVGSFSQIFGDWHGIIQETSGDVFFRGPQNDSKVCPEWYRWCVPDIFHACNCCFSLGGVKTYRFRRTNYCLIEADTGPENTGKEFRRWDQPWSIRDRRNSTSYGNSGNIKHLELQISEPQGWLTESHRMILKNLHSLLCKKKTLCFLLVLLDVSSIGSPKTFNN